MSVQSELYKMNVKASVSGDYQWLGYATLEGETQWNIIFIWKLNLVDNKFNLWMVFWKICIKLCGEILHNILKYSEYTLSLSWILLIKIERNWKKLNKYWALSTSSQAELMNFLL